jgi:hypothetical protein
MAVIDMSAVARNDRSFAIAGLMLVGRGVCDADADMEAEATDDSRLTL